MTRTVYFTATSLNGFIADEDNSLDWLFEVGEPDAQVMAAFMASTGVLVQGSTTYEWVLAHDEGDFAGGRFPTFVFTSRQLPVRAGADVRFVSGDVAAVHPDLVTAAAGKDIWVVGGGDLAGQFLDAGLLDELQISVTPVTLTGGAPLLPRRVLSAQLALRSVEQQGQFAHLIYDVRR